LELRHHDRAPSFLAREPSHLATQLQLPNLRAPLFEAPRPGRHLPRSKPYSLPSMGFRHNDRHSHRPPHRRTLLLPPQLPPSSPNFAPLALLTSSMAALAVIYIFHAPPARVPSRRYGCRSRRGYLRVFVRFVLRFDH